jgi:hypothetical protein
MNVTIGANDFYGVPFPLVLADRFFHIYAADTGFKVDTHGQSPWHFTGQALLDLNPGPPAISRTQ